MALFTAVLTERLGGGCGGSLLGALVALGVASVLYWHWTEQQGAGDLRFYYVVQFFPLLALPVLLLFFPARYTGTADLVAMLACYLIAKVMELMDGQIYAQGGFVSGHTLKHLIGGLSAYFILHMLHRRRPINRSVSAAGVTQPHLGACDIAPMPRRPRPLSALPPPALPPSRRPSPAPPLRARSPPPPPLSAPSPPGPRPPTPPTGPATPASHRQRVTPPPRLSAAAPFVD